MTVDTFPKVQVVRKYIIMSDWIPRPLEFSRFHYIPLKMYLYCQHTVYSRGRSCVYCKCSVLEVQKWRENLHEGPSPGIHHRLCRTYSVTELNMPSLCLPYVLKTQHDKADSKYHCSSETVRQNIMILIAYMALIPTLFIETGLQIQACWHTQSKCLCGK